MRKELREIRDAAARGASSAALSASRVAVRARLPALGRGERGVESLLEVPGISVRAAARGAALSALQAACSRAIARLLPRLARHAAGQVAASSAAVLVVEVGLDGAALVRGRIDRETFRSRATGAAATAALTVAAAALGLPAGPFVAGGLAVALLPSRERSPGRHEYHEALEEHLGRFHVDRDAA